MYRMSIPASRSVVAKVWRNICGVAAYCSGSFRRYFRIPYVVTHDVLKCQVPRTVAREESMALTLEQ